MEELDIFKLPSAATDTQKHKVFVYFTDLGKITYDKSKPDYLDNCRYHESWSTKMLDHRLYLDFYKAIWKSRMYTKKEHNTYGIVTKHEVELSQEEIMNLMLGGFDEELASRLMPDLNKKTVLYSVHRYTNKLAFNFIKGNSKILIRED